MKHRDPKPPPAKQVPTKLPPAVDAWRKAQGDKPTDPNAKPAEELTENELNAIVRRQEQERKHGLTASERAELDKAIHNEAVRFSPKLARPKRECAVLDMPEALKQPEMLDLLSELNARGGSGPDGNNAVGRAMTMMLALEGHSHGRTAHGELRGSPELREIFSGAEVAAVERARKRGETVADAEPFALPGYQSAMDRFKAIAKRGDNHDTLMRANAAMIRELMRLRPDVPFGRAVVLDTSLGAAWIAQRAKGRTPEEEARRRRTFPEAGSRGRKRYRPDEAADDFSPPMIRSGAFTTPRFWTRPAICRCAGWSSTPPSRRPTSSTGSWRTSTSTTRSSSPSSSSGTARGTPTRPTRCASCASGSPRSSAVLGATRRRATSSSSILASRSAGRSRDTPTRAS